MIIWNIVGAIWFGVVIWATVLTLKSKKLSILEKIIIGAAITSSFYLAAFVDRSYYREIFLQPDPEYALRSLTFI